LTTRRRDSKCPAPSLATCPARCISCGSASSNCLFAPAAMLLRGCPAFADFTLTRHHAAAGPAVEGRPPCAPFCRTFHGLLCRRLLHPAGLPPGLSCSRCRRARQDLRGHSPAPMLAPRLRDRSGAAMPNSASWLPACRYPRTHPWLSCHPRSLPRLALSTRALVNGRSAIFRCRRRRAAIAASPRTVEHTILTRPLVSF
jgi:hypothetical protein